MRSAGQGEEGLDAEARPVPHPSAAAGREASLGCRVAVLADTDSRWKWGMLTARRLGPARIDKYLLENPAPPSVRQFQAAGVDPDEVATLTLAELAGALGEAPPDVLVLSLPGGACQAALHALVAGWPPALRRPVVVTGYVGVVYEKVGEGLLLRAGADVVLANSADDADSFRGQLLAAGGDPSTVVETTLPFLRDLDPAPAASRPFTVTFAGQPGVPVTRWERAYLVDRLARHARLHPERLVTVKLRSVPGERVTHPEPYPYPDLLRKLPDRPANLQTVVGDMGEALRRTDLLVTVSSTAALEAMHAGVATVLLTDFGIRESLGNSYFAGSGCLGSFDDIDEGFAPRADPEWTRRHGVGGAGPDHLVERVRLLLGRELPPLEPYYTLRRSPAYLPHLLRAYGLAPDGQPLDPDLAHGQVRRLVRGAIRGTARTMYQSGVAVVAPALRKLGAL